MTSAAPVRLGLPYCWPHFRTRPLETALTLLVHCLQPILSPSILDHLINNDRKLPPEYNLPHTYVEMQVGEPAGPGLGAGPGEGAALASGGHFPPLAPNLVSLCVSWGAAPPRPVRVGVCCTRRVAKCPEARPHPLLLPTVAADRCLPLHGLPRGDRGAGLVHRPQSVQVSCGTATEDAGQGPRCLLTVQSRQCLSPLLRPRTDPHQVHWGAVGCPAASKGSGNSRSVGGLKGAWKVCRGGVTACPRL